MIKQKITAMVAATVLTLGVFSSVPSTPAKAQNKQDASIIIAFCKDAHAAFIRGDGGAYLHKGMAQLTPGNRPVVALACAAYGTGYEEGKRTIRYA